MPQEKMDEIVEMPERSMTFKIKDFEYQNINYPTVGKFIDIQTLKMQYSSNTYAHLADTGSMDSYRAQMMIDTVATFQILFGDKLKKDLTVKSLFDLDLIQMNTVIDAYIKQYIPWHQAWIKYLDQLKNGEDEA